MITIDNDNSALQCNTIITMNILLNSMVNNAYNDYNIVVYYYNICNAFLQYCHWHCRWSGSQMGPLFFLYVLQLKEKQWLSLLRQNALRLYKSYFYCVCARPSRAT